MESLAVLESDSEPPENDMDKIARSQQSQPVFAPSAKVAFYPSYDGLPANEIVAVRGAEAASSA